MPIHVLQDHEDARHAYCGSRALDDRPGYTADRRASSAGCWFNHCHAYCWSYSFGLGHLPKRLASGGKLRAQIEEQSALERGCLRLYWTHTHPLTLASFYICLEIHKGQSFRSKFGLVNVHERLLFVLTQTHKLVVNSFTCMALYRVRGKPLCPFLRCRNVLLLCGCELFQLERLDASQDS